MGYYTYYDLGISPHGRNAFSNEEIDELEKEIDLLNVFESGNIVDGYYCNAKWYDHDDDMMRLSGRFPDILFSLHGDGENREDMWETYYLNGRMQYCEAEITYPPFDESRLSEPIEDGGERYSYQTRDVPPRTPPSKLDFNAVELL